MKYKLTNQDNTTQPARLNILATLRRFWPFVVEEKTTLIGAFLAILISSGLAIWAPALIGHAIDKYLFIGDYQGILRSAGTILLVYTLSAAASFIQTRLTGGVGQRVLFRLRNGLFTRLAELPVAFFNQNKAGDLISRINNDTDKLNQFFSRSLMQFVGNVFVILGAGITMVWVQHRLGLAALAPALVLLILARFTSAWIKQRNLKNLQALGGLSGEIQESLDNFKVIIAFNRRDYFRKRFEEVNENNYQAALSAGIANITFTPIFGLASNLGQLIVITYGLWLISQGAFSFGLLISFLAYVSRFYDPLRQMAALWADFQTALAAWDRIAEILDMESDLQVVESNVCGSAASLLEFQEVSFAYPGGKPVLQHISFALQTGKTYALVGPTGGGKTTTASLMARLYDPTSGTVFLEGKDIRTYPPEKRTQKIGFILQEPFLFGGTVRDNLVYGNEKYQGLSSDEFAEALEKDGLSDLMQRFDQGLDTVVGGGDSISLGQRQLIAFLRSVLRHPDILILDEATANVDTVTEKLLQDILDRLPEKTTRVVIAHRLNTIQNADEIFFVNAGEVQAAGSFEHAVELLTSGKRSS